MNGFYVFSVGKIEKIKGGNEDHKQGQNKITEPVFSCHGLRS